MDVKELEQRAVDLLGPPDGWHGRCHELSHALVRAGWLGPRARVARGWCDGVRSQHSWVAISGDCYSRTGRIVDPTLHTYRDDVEVVLFVGTLTRPGWHTPHQAGVIWTAGTPKPVHDGGRTIELDTERMSSAARAFLSLIQPLDLSGWCTLVHGPMEGWPAAEVIDALCDTEVRPHIPVDVVGMLTERNPGGSYR